ncbi:MAG TPA: RNA ligase family protein [Bacillota bacterium]|nr:RNA ligase family protein [Bacillota bacterium]HOK68527.1 RNA ligase family protein [Bacillota bacterium]HPP86172.1 RNA ligase family protein [Bacillota bacterium]
MTDIFETKDIKPMLIGETAEAFDSEDFIYELKLDGERCIAYLDPNTGTELRNKRNMRMLAKVPELSEIHRQVKSRCILDGELIILKDGKPDFFEIQKRSLTANSFKIKLHSAQFPASFIAFDVLYHIDRETVSLPLTERKQILDSLIVQENDRLSVSRFIEREGKAFYELAVRQELEGVVAKRKDSKYFFGKRTKDWIKIKNLLDADFVMCGYIEKENNVISVVLGQYREGRLIYKGHVTLGVSSDDFRIMAKQKTIDFPPFQETPPGNENAVWIEPNLVCTVQYMMKTGTGSMRQPVFKGLRADKLPEECVESV